MPTHAKTKPAPDKLTIELSAKKRLALDPIGLDVQASMDKLVELSRDALQQIYPDTKLSLMWLNYTDRETVQPWPASEADRVYFKAAVLDTINTVWRQSHWLQPVHPDNESFLEDFPGNTKLQPPLPSAHAYIEQLISLPPDQQHSLSYQLQKWCFEQNKPAHLSTCAEAIAAQILEQLNKAHLPIIHVIAPDEPQFQFNMPKIVASKPKPAAPPPPPTKKATKRVRSTQKDGIW